MMFDAGSAAGGEVVLAEPGAGRHALRRRGFGARKTSIGA